MARILSVITLIALAGAGASASAASLAVSVRQRDNTPLAGAVITAHPESARLPRPAPVRAIVDQVNLAFVPEVLVIPVGSAVEFPNSDAVSHQVYSFSATKRFQLPLYRGKRYPPVQFDEPGVVTLGCNIHDNMLAYLVVTDAPYFGRTREDGAWSVADLPSGTYRIRVWHPQLGDGARALERVTTIAEGARAEITLQLQRPLRPAPISARPKKWDAY